MNHPLPHPTFAIGLSLLGLAAGPTFAPSAHGQCYTITLPQIGEREFCVSQPDLTGAVAAPELPSVAAFRPPSIFSAPLPSGSGARAMGLAGAFTAVADDATAASWNPAGLARLERPEASVVFRSSRERDEHRVEDPTLQVGEDEFDNDNLNYFSLVYPFQRQVFGRNVVVSLNYQEAYDFSQRFSANFSDRDASRRSSMTANSFSATTTEPVTGGDAGARADYTLNILTQTDQSTSFDQRLSSDVLADISFEQEGIIDAVTPALAVALTPKLYFGASLNVYQDSPMSGNHIRSRTRATYTGQSSSEVESMTASTTTASYSYEGRVTLPAVAGFPEIEIPVEGEGDLGTLSTSDQSNRMDRVVLDGIYEEVSAIDDLRGINATIGMLWDCNRHLTLGASLDLPWTADARQHRTVHQRATTSNASRTRVLDESDSVVDEIKDVEFDFPLFWSVGALWRWTSHFYTSVDVSQTLWSDFAFQAEGEERINPLDGTPHSENPLDDTWSYRLGMEYLFVGRRFEIPLRAGVAYEERPALDEPDEFLVYSVGTGIGLGKEPHRTYLDVAYVFTEGDDVRGVIPEQEDLRSDVTEHQIIVSLIQHF